MTVTRPVLIDSEAINKDKINKTMDLLSSPRTRVISIAMATTATTGIVKPIVAKAEPSARFRLVCSWLFAAARNEA